jgi:hypothetical protein
VTGLSEKKKEEETKETNKFESLVADLDTQRDELTTKKANQPLGTLTYADKKAFIQSEAGQALMEKMNSQTLKTNAEELMDEVDDLLTTKRVMDIDPADEYSETATILVNTYSWSGGGVKEEPKEPGDGANTVTHLVDGGTYSYSYVTGAKIGFAVYTTAAGESNGDKENPAIVNTLNVGSWKISPEPMSKSGDTFIAQEVVVDEETGVVNFGMAIPIGQFSNDSISWTTSSSRLVEDTIHTVTYQNPISKRK